MFTRDIGVDLGTSNTRVCLKGRGIITSDPSVVAYDVSTDVIRAVGKYAKDMIGRTPGSIVAVKPLKDGVIADFDVTTAMLRQFVRKAQKGSLFSRVRMVICLPSGITEVETRAVYDAAKQAGATDIDLVEALMSSAVGAGLPVLEAKGNMIVDIGGGTTEAAVISLGDIVTSQSIRVAGDKLDEAIISHIRKKHNLLIGEATAEKIKIEIGSALPFENEPELEIRGRNLADGLPKNITISGEFVRSAMQGVINQIVDVIRTTLERTPPELSADIIDTGINICGGTALLPGLCELISEETGMSVHVVDKPFDCGVIGTESRLENDPIFANYVFKRAKQYKV